MTHENISVLLPSETLLKELITEASNIFQLLDSASDSIRRLESNLVDKRAFFTFRFLISKEEPSHPKELLDVHRNNVYGAEFFTLQIHWYLSWESDDNTNKYRLFLTSEEKEFVHAPYEDQYSSHEYRSKQLFKKPLIETNIQTRLEYIKYLTAFIQSFTEYLKLCRSNIENSLSSF